MKEIIFRLIFACCAGIGIGAFWCWLKERRDRAKWNNGVCPDCGTAFKPFDTDSTGCTGYKCENKHYFWK